MGDSDLERVFPDPDKRRFVQLFNEIQAAQGASNHAQTLIAAFRDRGISGASARDRFLAVLQLTGGSGPPTLNINDTLFFIGNSKTTPRRAGDTGFRRELRDSIQFKQVNGQDVEMWLRSSNQIGHFLTAAHFAYYIRTKQNYYDAVERRRAKARAEASPVMRWVLDFADGLSRSPDGLDPELIAAMEADAYRRAMVGHELVRDGGVWGSGFANGASSGVAGMLTASDADVGNFLQGRLDQIGIDPKQAGNSFQDILLTWVGYRFGENMANAKFSSREDAASWLELMLTEQDLSKVAGDSRFAKDAQDMLRLLVQFRRTQEQPSR